MFYVQKYNKQWVFAYEAYLINDFDATIIDNENNRTSLQANKNHFKENSNVSGKIVVRNRKIVNLGLSYIGGIYNKFQDDGFILSHATFLKTL